MKKPQVYREGPKLKNEKSSRKKLEGEAGGKKR